MPARAPSIADQPQLPNELYRDIIENLHYLRDRRTLLRLTLISKAWCGESQRVLFRTVCDDSMDSDRRGSLIRTHTLFLKAIILNPPGLAHMSRHTSNGNSYATLFLQHVQILGL
ncbi:hypothetical protein D9619_004425 [Psilocybe cf. subviscida]|uniref:F-box domain-containing protein n=1 Tax=Psilocybe cf. subviscida TaxID=2480587 RepID=A0A8H5BQG7_9AGAR|nr:hypothetical protein D9619_004425 [Psilocybe cf. subviscida]